jgi:uncharacterized protein YukE
MRNKLKVISFILVLALVVPYVTLAQDTSRSTDADTSTTTDSNNSDIGTTTNDSDAAGTGDTTDRDADNTGDTTDRDDSKPSVRDRLQNATDVLRNRADEVRDRANTDERNVDKERTSEREEIRDEQRARHLLRLKNSMARHINRMQHAINRLQNIIERIEGAIRKLNEREIDTSSVDSLVSRAKSEKAEAVRLLEDVKAKHGAIADSEDTREAVKTFISSLRSLKDQLIKLHKTLQEIVPILKRLANSSTNQDGEDNN